MQIRYNGIDDTLALRFSIEPVRELSLGLAANTGPSGAGSSQLTVFGASATGCWPPQEHGGIPAADEKNQS
ncbi:hypothetical protein [Paraburkholderia sp. MM5477-R1]|uniref:hypothetical protein n=1 Tax=Paraburkholderia sp. MM5477-R1 TaxID=2991062 RepID=UPI003D2233E7